MLFLGEYLVSFSGQGRIIIPKKIREALDKTKTFTLTKGFDRCLSGFRNVDWEKETLNLMGSSALTMQKVDTKRHLFSSAVNIEIDDQGRFVIPKNLLEYAELSSKEAILIGVGTYFEVWQPEKWKKYIKSVESNIKDLSKEQ